MQRLREARGLNYGDYAYIEHFVQEGGDAVAAQTGRVRHQGEFTIWLRPVQNENALFAARAALYELVRSYTDEPFSEAEVERTKGFLDGYVLLYAQTAARRLGYALDDQALDPGCDLKFIENLRRDLAKVTAADVNRVWSRMKELQPKLQLVLVGPKAQEMKKVILSNAPTPIHYQKDADGKSPERPKAQLDADAQIARLPWGAKADSDVEIVPVAQMFE
jgi:zinc protease